MSRKPQKADARGGTYFLLPHCLIKSEAWLTASNRAIKALFVVAGKHSGFNNGKIAVSAIDLAEGMACQNHRANSLALAELCARGILEQTSNYPKGVRLAREFRVTFIPTEAGPATHDYLGWKIGDAGTVSPREIGNKGKKRIATAATENGVSIAAIATETKLSIATAATVKNGSHAKLPFLNEPTVATAAIHIVNHLPDGGTGHSRSQGNANGTSLKTAGANSCAPDPEELRDRTLAFLEKLGRGGQGRLAKQANIPGGTLSKFLQGKGPLNPRARVRLTCAFPRTEAAALKNERTA